MTRLLKIAFLGPFEHGESSARLLYLLSIVDDEGPFSGVSRSCVIVYIIFHKRIWKWPHLTSGCLMMAQDCLDLMQ